MKFSRIWELIQDDTRMLSATRLAFLLTLFAVLGVWLTDCWHQKKMTSPDRNAVYLVLTLMAGKVGQSFAENQPSISPKPPEPNQ